MSFVDELAHALQVFRAAAGIPEPKRRAARPPPAPKPKRRRRTASARVAKPKVTLSADTVFVDGKPERMRCLPDLAAIATVSAAPAGTRAEKKNADQLPLRESSERASAPDADDATRCSSIPARALCAAPATPTWSHPMTERLVRNCDATPPEWLANPEAYVE